MLTPLFKFDKALVPNAVSCRPPNRQFAGLLADRLYLCGEFADYPKAIDGNGFAGWLSDCRLAAVVARRKCPMAKNTQGSKGRRGCHGRRRNNNCCNDLSLMAQAVWRSRRTNFDLYPAIAYVRTIFWLPRTALTAKAPATEIKGTRTRHQFFKTFDSRSAEALEPLLLRCIELGR
jgi:hypothetical protein